MTRSPAAETAKTGAAPTATEGAIRQSVCKWCFKDIALDPFPYNGMTTTCDALWMGVPVVSLVGRRNLSRAGLSLLRNVGLGAFAVDSVDAYVDLAIRTSNDPAALTELRAGLRERLRSSPLLDAQGFTGKVETAFRGMWLEWCRRQGKVA